MNQEETDFYIFEHQEPDKNRAIRQAVMSAVAGAIVISSVGSAQNPKTVQPEPQNIAAPAPKQSSQEPTVVEKISTIYVDVPVITKIPVYVTPSPVPVVTPAPTPSPIGNTTSPTSSASYGNSSSPTAAGSGNNSGPTAASGTREDDD